MTLQIKESTLKLIVGTAALIALMVIERSVTPAIKLFLVATAYVTLIESYKSSVGRKKE